MIRTPADEEGITCCLRQVQSGQAGAEDRLLRQVYNHLRRMAGKRMRRERIDHTLQPTALANEVWLKLIETVRRYEWKDSDHFYAACARMMRNILVDYARRRKFEKIDLDLCPDIAITEQRSEELLALDAALDRLALFDPRGARVVELIWFGGLTQQEAANALAVSERTIKRDFSACRTWLRAHMLSLPDAAGESKQPAALAASH